MSEENELKYNNATYGRGVAYIAKLSSNCGDNIELDKRGKPYDFKREFINRTTNYTNNSKTTWYDYCWKIATIGLYEKFERNSFKTRVVYFEYDGENIFELTKKEMLDRLELGSC